MTITRVHPNGALPGGELLNGRLGVQPNTVRSAQAAHGLQIEPSRTGAEWNPAGLFCAKITKAGTPCKAKPVGNTELCVGHTRQVAAEVARAAKG